MPGWMATEKTLGMLMEPPAASEGKLIGGLVMLQLPPRHPALAVMLVTPKKRSFSVAPLMLVMVTPL